MKAATVVYLRAGRQKRASGIVCGNNRWGVVVQPAHPGWKRIPVTHQEIAAGSEKPPSKPRVKREGEPVKRKPRAPKPTPEPRWKTLVAAARDAGKPSEYGGLLGFITDLADELETAHARLAEFLPINMKP